jgi:hypothetical protein
MAVGSAINRNNYYPYPAWGYGGVYYGGRPYYPPPYRPVYPGYRPAYGYHPPPNYHWNQYNKNVNVTVNNNYYNKFNSNTVTTRDVKVNNINANNRPALSGGNQAGGQPNWKGQSAYQGARPNNANQKPGASMASANPANRPNAGNTAATANRPNPGNNVATANRPSYGKDMPANRSNLAANPAGNNVTRPATANAAAINRPNAANPGTTNRAAAPTNMNRGGDRGYSNATVRPGGDSQAARPAPPAQNRGGGSNSAFANSGSAKSERAASNRGQASTGGSARGGKASPKN